MSITSRSIRALAVGLVLSTGACVAEIGEPPGPPEEAREGGERAEPGVETELHDLSEAPEEITQGGDGDGDGAIDGNLGESEEALACKQTKIAHAEHCMSPAALNSEAYLWCAILGGYTSCISYSNYCGKDGYGVPYYRSVKFRC